MGEKPKCPECKTEEMEYTGDDHASESGEMYDVKVYKCPKCLCEFDEDELRYDPFADCDEGDNAWFHDPDMGARG